MKKLKIVFVMVACMMLSGFAYGQINVKVYSYDADAMVSVSYYPSNGLAIITASLPEPVNYFVLQETLCCLNGSYSFAPPLSLSPMFDMMKIQVESGGVILEKRYSILFSSSNPSTIVFDFTTCFGRTN